MKCEHGFELCGICHDASGNLMSENKNNSPTDNRLMNIVIVDIEADGPIPGDYSMISLGAVILDDKLDKTFLGLLKPISSNWVPQALAVSGFTREETQHFDPPHEVMKRFFTWLEENCEGHPMFFSDNNGFDWQFVNWYAHHFIGRNPFGHSSTNIGSLYKGMMKNMHKNFKHLRKTKHTHNPVDDAKGNAEALLAMQRMGLKMTAANRKNKDGKSWSEMSHIEREQFNRIYGLE